MKQAVPATHPPDADAIAAAASGLPAGRILPLEVGGKRYWVKRAETLAGRMRLQKGSPGRAFARERAALAALSSEGLPVPRVVAEGPGWFAIPDAGTSLKLLARRGHPGPARRAVYFAGGGALAALHVAGHAHGRPSLRDLCWDEVAGITIIDFERYSPKGNTRRRMVRDLVMLVHSAYVEFAGDEPEIDALCDGYRAKGGAEIWQGAASLCRVLRWVGPLTRPLRGRVPPRREFEAIPLTLQRFAAG